MLPQSAGGPLILYDAQDGKRGGASGVSSGSRAGSGDKHRGFMTGLVNATCPAAQIVIGAAGGAIVQAAGNAHVLFAVTGGLAGAASILVLLSPTRGGMVPRGAAAASTGGQGSGV